MINVKSRRKIERYKSRFSWFRVIIFVVIIGISAGLLFGFKAPIEAKLNPNANTNNQQIDEAGLTVHFIDIGQGDSIAIRFPDNKTMLIDAGDKLNQNQLVNYLNTNFFKQGENTFDYLLLTHSDADHSGGMVKICNEYVINKIFRPKIYSVYSKKINNVNTIIYDELNGNYTNKNTCTTLTYYNTIMAFNNETSNIVFMDIEQMNSSQKIQGKGYYFEFYSPNTDYITESEGTIMNDHSPIMCLNYNDRKIMFTGDASFTAEREAMLHHDLPDVDILKVGHHGSKTSTSTEFLQEIKPEHSIISCGVDNDYGHPKQEVLNRLTEVGSKIYRTDTDGSIVVNIKSTDNAINIFVGDSAVFSSRTSIYIKVEYIFAGIVVITIYFCFGIRIKTR